MLHLAGSVLPSYVQETNVIRQCSFYVLFMSCYYSPNAFVLGDVRCNFCEAYIFCRTAGLVISPPDKILLYTVMYAWPIRASVTGPSICIVNQSAPSIFDKHVSNEY